ncbi:MAG TPA: hypothetical protein VJH06_01125 [Candidatus Paceibacterota bacterium]
MEITKNNRVLLVILIVVLVLAVFSSSNKKKNYSLSDLGVAPLVKSDCSSFKDKEASSPVTISFDVPNVSSMREKIMGLIEKHKGHITSDSFNSYPGSFEPGMPPASSQDELSINATFEKSQAEFLTELSNLVKSVGGTDTNYNYTDGSKYAYGYGTGYSSYSSCNEMLQFVQADMLQLEVLIKALKEEHDPSNISLLSQAISNVKTTLQTDVNSLNDFFSAPDKPSVNISVYTLQKDIDFNLKRVY